MCRTSRKSGALAYRIPMGLFRPVAGRLYFFISLLINNLQCRCLYFLRKSFLGHTPVWKFSNSCIVQPVKWLVRRSSYRKNPKRAFRYFREISKKDLSASSFLSVRPSVRMEQIGSRLTDLIKLAFGLSFENLSINFKFH
jgi:hypothetical protein